MIEKNLQAVAIAYKKLKADYYPGKSVDKMRREFLHSIKTTLGDCVLKYDFICGTDTLNVDGVTKDYIPKQNDTLIIDISVRYQGRWCDVCRTFFFGEPTKNQKAVYRLIERSITVGEKSLKAGTRASEIYSAVNSVYERDGLKLIHHAGHKIGSRALMQPQFLSEKTAKVKPGELYTIESGLYDGFGIRLENDYLIEENGARNLFIDLMPLNIKEYILK